MTLAPSANNQKKPTQHPCPNRDADTRFRTGALSLNYLGWTYISIKSGLVAFQQMHSTCRVSLVVNGGWTQWAVWSNCDPWCGGNGTQERTRDCTDPEPQYGGLNCTGITYENQTCGPPCPSKQSSFMQMCRPTSTSPSCFYAFHIFILAQQHF